MRADERTDRHDEANSRFSEFCGRASTLGISTSSTRSTVLTKVFIFCGFMAPNCGRKLQTAM